MLARPPRRRARPRDAHPEPSRPPAIPRRGARPVLGRRGPPPRVRRRQARVLPGADRLRRHAVPERAPVRRVRPGGPPRRRAAVPAGAAVGGPVRRHPRRAAVRVRGRVVGEHRDHAGARLRPDAPRRRGRHAGRAAEAEGRRGRGRAGHAVAGQHVRVVPRQRRPDEDARRGDPGLLRGHRRALLPLPPQRRRLPHRGAAHRDQRRVHAPPEDRHARRRHAGGRCRPPRRQLHRRHRPLRWQVRRREPHAVPGPGHEIPPRLHAEQLQARVPAARRAAGAVARRALQAGGPRGVGRAHELRAAVEEAGAGGHARLPARSEPGDAPRPRRPRRRHRLVERAGVPVHRRGVGGGVPVGPGGGGRAGADERQGRDGGPEHPDRLRRGHPARAAVRLHREPVLPGRVRVVGGGPGRRVPEPGARRGGAQGRRKDPARRAVRGVRRDADVARGRARRRARAGHPALEQAHRGDDVPHRHGGHRRRRAARPGAPLRLPQLLLPREPGGAASRRVRAAGGAGGGHGLLAGSGEPPRPHLRARQAHDRGRRVRHRRLGEPERAVAGGEPGQRDRAGELPAGAPERAVRACAGAGARVPDVAVARALHGAPRRRRGRRGRVPGAREPGVRAGGAAGGGAAVGRVHAGQGGGPAGAPAAVPDHRVGVRRGGRLAGRRVLPGHEGAREGEESGEASGHSHHMRTGDG